jgi:uncharacterized phage protein gp47/JayE
MPTQLTPAGLEVETYEEIRSDVAAAIRARVSQTANLEEDSLLGNLVSIVSTKVRQVGEALEAVYASFDPDGNTGASQDHVAAITGTTREAATYSTVTATVTVAPGTYGAGKLIAHVKNDPKVLFTNVEVVSNDGTESAPIDALFRALSAGPVEVLAGQLTVIAGSVAGWLSVTNAEAAAPGRSSETDVELRRRREEELFAQGSTTVDAIRGDLLRNIPGIESVIVIENASDEADENGIPPHNIEVIVVAPTVADDVIAQQIWDSKAGGGPTHRAPESSGATAIAVDSQGVEHEVHFSRQQDVEVYVRLELEVLADAYVGDEAFRQSFADAANAYYGVARDVKLSKLFAFAHSIGGVFGVASLETSADDGLTWAPADVVIGFRERARFSTARVTVTSSPVAE